MNKKFEINPEHRLSDLTSLAKSVNPLLRNILGERGMIFMELLNSWEQIIGKQQARYCLPQNVTFKKGERTGGCLNVAVLSGAFAMEIQQQQRQIIERVNSFLGYPAIDKIKIFQSGNPENFLIDKKPIDKMKKKVVSKEDESYITELIKDINNDELRHVLQNIGRSVFSDKSNQE